MDRFPLAEAILGYLELSDGTPTPHFSGRFWTYSPIWRVSPNRYLGSIFGVS